jgi:Cu(I)-responsive transcriptional regulator
MMTIGDVARAADLPTKTVRYYADIGLVAPSGRSDAGYRLYGRDELARLVFVRRARSFGFSVDMCRELLGLYGDQARASHDVKQLALARLDEIDARMAELASLRAELTRLADACQGNDRPDCPILDTLAT